MKIDQLKEGTTLTMKVSGRLDTMTAPQLENEITGQLDGITEFIMNFLCSGIYFQRRFKSSFSDHQNDEGKRPLRDPQHQRDGKRDL